MKQSPKKRLPQGTTSALVLGALALLVAKDRWGRGVTRAALLWELNLPETTVDDRLRTLVKQGRVERLGRARYKLKH